MATLSTASVSRVSETARPLLGPTLIAFACGAAALAGFAPLELSIVALFLFAGPHNWMEFRCFLSQMPSRWGPMRTFYLTAIAGTVALTAAYVWIDAITLSVWNTLFLLWVGALLYLRRKRPPAWMVSILFFAIAAAWLFPQPWDLVLVYLHPILALVFFDRMIRPEHRRMYRLCLLAVPIFVAGLYWQVSGGFSEPDALTQRITQQVGADVIESVSPRFLVASHVFLQMLHYGVWILAVPLVALKKAPWDLSGIPLAKRFRWGVALPMILGAGAVAALWGGFSVDYVLTRDIYFTAAMLHVLAEFPFLVRSL